MLRREQFLYRNRTGPRLQRFDPFDHHPSIRAPIPLMSVPFRHQPRNDPSVARNPDDIALLDHVQNLEPALLCLQSQNIPAYPASPGSSARVAAGSSFSTRATNAAT